MSWDIDIKIGGKIHGHGCKKVGVSHACQNACISFLLPIFNACLSDLLYLTVDTRKINGGWIWHLILKKICRNYLTWSGMPRRAKRCHLDSDCWVRPGTPRHEIPAGPRLSLLCQILSQWVPPSDLQNYLVGVLGFWNVRRNKWKTCWRHGVPRDI